MDAIQSQLHQFENEMKEYELLKSGRLNHVVINSFSNFYEVLIKGRIIKKWSHADLAKQLKVKEQQIQRYEGNNYSSASIDRISEVVAALDLEIQPIKIKVTDVKFMLPKGEDRFRINEKLNAVRERQSLLPQ